MTRTLETVTFRALLILAGCVIGAIAALAVFMPLEPAIFLERW